MADPVADLSSLENLPDKCNQPRRFSFPQREFGKQSKVKRSFQPSWFDRWTWLHYRADNDSVVYFTCLRTHSLKRLQWSSNADQAFLAKGFCNWKNACVKFDSHQASRCHKEAVLKMVSLPATTQDVGESLSSQHQSEKEYMMKLYNAEIFCCHGCMVEPDTTVIFITTLVRKGVPSQPSWATPLENCFRRP